MKCIILFQLLLVVLGVSYVYAESSSVSDATENTNKIVKKQPKWKELLARVFPGDNTNNVCKNSDNSDSSTCESSAESRDDTVIAQESSKWREFLSKLLKYFKGKSIVGDEMSKEQMSRWQLFVAYIESNLKVMVSESSETIKKSVKKSFETIRGKTKRFKASKDPYILVQYTTNLSLNQVYNVLKAYNQAYTAGHEYILAYWIPYNEPYPVQYYHDITTLKSIFPENIHLLIIDESLFHNTIGGKYNVSMNDVESDRLTEYIVDIAHVLSKNTTNLIGKSDIYWMVSSNVTWIGSLPNVLARWKNDYDYLAAGCDIYSDNDALVSIDGSHTLQCNHNSSNPLLGLMSKCNNNVSRIQCHPELVRYSSKLLDFMDANTSFPVDPMNVIAYRNHLKLGDLLDLGWSEEILGADFAPRSGIHERGLVNQLYHSFLEKLKDEATSGDAHDNASISHTTEQKFKLLESEFKEGIFQRTGIVFRNLTRTKNEG